MCTMTDKETKWIVLGFFLLLFIFCTVMYLVIMDGIQNGAAEMKRTGTDQCKVQFSRHKSPTIDCE